MAHERTNPVEDGLTEEINITRARDKKLRIMSITTILFYRKMESTILFFVFTDIIQVELYLLSRLQNPSRQIVDKVVADLRERYILRCRSRKRRHLFY